MNAPSKFQVPNSKFQRSSKSQIPAGCAGDWFGSWNLEFPWNLEFGIWNLELGTWNFDVDPQ